MSPKEALAKDGKVPVKMGQGRLSRAGIERCKELAAEGWNIDGYQVVTPTKSPATNSNVSPVEVRKVAVSNSEKVIADLPPMRYDERVYKAVSEVAVFGKKEFTMREVCRTCGSSLSYHYCDNPVVLGVPVRIVTR